MAELNSDSNLQYLKGVGPRRAEALSKIGLNTVHDLLYYIPRAYLDRGNISDIGDIKANTDVTLIGRVYTTGILKGRRQRFEAVIGDDTGYIALIWFSGFQYLEKMIKKGDIFAVTGRVTYFMQHQIVHPELERIEDEDSRLIHTGRIVPVYPSTGELKKAGITGRMMRQLISGVLSIIGPKIGDYLPAEILSGLGLPDLSEALRQIHYPDDMTLCGRARRRLAFDELLELQYIILNARKSIKEITKNHQYLKKSLKAANLVRRLPFRLTEDQKNTLKDIFDDMRSPKPMHRLVHGDVGCGKTVVAILAAVYCVESGMQCAFMAPTEILAEQHFQKWQEPLTQLGIQAALVTGSIPKRERNALDKKIISGETDLVFGTHALLSTPLEFKNLGLVVIDEQHRFGVLQRGRLVGKGSNPDVLVMSATPIPRTLALTLYGDLDISSIKSMPPGRLPTKSVWRSADSRADMYRFLKGRVNEGEQIFIIYPLVEKSEKLDLQAAEEEYKNLKDKTFKEFRLGIVHGRTKREQREKVIRDFRNRKIDILVATTVIEVGLDIPSATIMIIEHAERFGLSQLHQLRGRVGRGAAPGLVVAVAVPPISQIARKRLELFTTCGDGFKIAEADLELRGPGEFFGTRQHGLPELKIANLATDADLLPSARKILGELLNPDKSLDKNDKRIISYLKQRASHRHSWGRFG